MTRRLIAALALAVATTTVGSVRAQKPDQAAVLLEAAKQKETLEGDLTGAIKHYQDIVQAYGKTNRGVAAEALLRMAALYQRQGDARARAVYESILKDFGDQAAAREAQARLASLAVAATQSQPVVSRRLLWEVPRAPSFYPAAALSRDGRYIAYADWDLRDLFIHDLVAGSDRRVTQDAVKDASGRLVEYAENGAVLSRDGTQLAYGWVKGEKSELRVVSVAPGGIQKPRVLVANPEVLFASPYEWTPNGESILVQVGRPDRTFQLGLVSTRDGALTILKSTDWRDGGSVFLSPDGKNIAFDQRATRGDASDIFVLAIDGSRQIHVVDHPANDELAGWTPDGRQLLFTSDRRGSVDLWSVEFTGASERRDPELVRPDIGQFTWSLGVSSTGSLYTFVRGSTSSETRMASLDFASGQVLSPPVLAGRDFIGATSLPTWSPDGTSLSWLSQGRPVLDDKFSLALRPAAGGRAVEWPLELNQVQPLGIQWTHDSRGFMVFGRDRDNRNGIFRIDAQTRAMSVVTLGGPFGSERGLRPVPRESSWSSDGTKFYFLRDAPRAVGEGALIERDIASGTERELYRGTIRGLKISPDHQTLYFEREILQGAQTVDGFRERILVERTLSSGQERELLRSINPNEIRLSPDGQYISTGKIDSATKARSVGIVRVRDGQYRELMRGVAPQESLSVAAWSPDSQSVIVSQRLASGTRETWWAPIDDRAPRKLPIDTRAGSLEIHPDGRQVVLQTQSERKSNEVWVLEQFWPRRR